MRYWYWLLVLLLMAGCAETHSGGVDKRYDVTIRVTGDHNSFSMGVEADTAAESSAGDADATIDPRISGSLYGPSNVEGIMKDLSYIIEKWQKNETTTTETNVPSSGGNGDSGEVPDTGGSDTDGSGGDGSDSGMVISGWDVVNSFPCDQWMNFKDDEEMAAGEAGEKQKKCLFTDYLSCEELPDSFMVVWKEGDKVEQLQVPNKCNMTWVAQDKDYRKYRPTDDKEPHPVAYAARGTDPTDVYILVKKQ